MSTRVKVGLVAASVVVAFAFGRFTTPEKVRVETRVVEVEKKIKLKDTRKETKVVEVTKPDGTKEKTKTIVENTKAGSLSDKASLAEKTSESNRGAARTTISVLVGGSVASGPSGNLALGGHVSRTVLGPISVGVWGLSNLTFGGSVGVNF